MRRIVRGLFPFCLMVLFTLSAPTAARAQDTPPMPSSQVPGQTAPPPDRSERQMLRQMERERNDLRQKQLVDDANKLFDLAKKLKAEVDKSDKDQLSLSVVDTASQIEKLAKNVKDKMRDGS